MRREVHDRVLSVDRTLNGIPVEEIERDARRPLAFDRSSTSRRARDRRNVVALRTKKRYQAPADHAGCARQQNTHTTS